MYHVRGRGSTCSFRASVAVARETMRCDQLGRWSGGGGTSKIPSPLPVLVALFSSPLMSMSSILPSSSSSSSSSVTVLRIT